MKDNNLIDQLSVVLPNLPMDEVEWLVAHGNYEKHDTGTVLALKGKRIEKLWIILSGHISVKRDLGAGPQQVMQWHSGDVTGMLPYSRMTGPPGDNYLEESAELISIHEKHFHEMTCRCPVFTSYTVHSMLDRARNFKTSDLHHEKMISLGKLAAGLAHELNNPASAAVRNAKLLISILEETEAASRMLGAINLNYESMNILNQVRSDCLDLSSKNLLSPIQQAENEDNIADWLKQHNIDTALTESLAATSITIDGLDKLANSIPGNIISVALQWIAATCTARSLVVDIEMATSRISDIVTAVKRFTYMDKLSTTDLVDIGTGLRDTIKILTSKVKSKGATINLEIEPGLPCVKAAGGELNQVWLNLIDNALDAIPNFGRVEITAKMEMEQVIVRIIDNGTGIPPEIIYRIFDPFFTTKPPGQGTGLGLDITRRLLRQFHGDINVQSKPGLTEFRVNLVAGKSP